MKPLLVNNNILDSQLRKNHSVTALVVGVCLLINSVDFKFNRRRYIEWCCMLMSFFIFYFPFRLHRMHLMLFLLSMCMQCCRIHFITHSPMRNYKIFMTITLIIRVSIACCIFGSFEIYEDNVFVCFLLWLLFRCFWYRAFAFRHGEIETWASS